MPNWVTNRIIFPNEDIAKQAHDLFNTEDTTANGVAYDTLDFDRIIPRPEALEITDGSDMAMAVHVALAAAKLRGEPCDDTKVRDNPQYQDLYERGLRTPIVYKLRIDTYLNALAEADVEVPTAELVDAASDDDFDALAHNVAVLEGAMIENGLADQLNNYSEDDEMPLYGLVAYGSRAIDNIVTYGYPGWYMWSWANWGCKWNASNTCWGDDWVEFWTPWDTVTPILEAMAKRLHAPLTLIFAEEQFTEYVGYAIATNEGVICDERNTSEGLDAWEVKLTFSIASLLLDDEQDDYRFDEAHAAIVCDADEEFEDLPFVEPDLSYITSRFELVCEKEVQ